METVLFNEVKNWMYRNARHLEWCLWQYHFENGSKEAVVDALMVYQNEDGGFGNALEPDCWNPNSSPYTTSYAISVLKQIDFMDMSHEIFKGIWKYLESYKDLLSYGWRFSIPTNDDYPRAPWWNFSDEENKKEYFGITAELSAFILKYGNRESALWKKALQFTDELFVLFNTDKYYGDMGLQGFVTLIDTVRELGLTEHYNENLPVLLKEKIKNAIEHDTEKWAYYGVRPSQFIVSPNSPFYAENAEIVHEELEYLVRTRPEHDVWAITWTWFDNMEKYEAFFRISENWWKGIKAMEKMRFLQNFGVI